MLKSKRPYVSISELFIARLSGHQMRHKLYKKWLNGVVFILPKYGYFGHYVGAFLLTDMLKKVLAHLLLA